MSEFVRVLPAAELPPGGRKLVDVGGKCVLVCHAAGAFYAISNVCSHAEKPLARGRIMGASIVCPTHGARFELATGRPLCAPAVRPIAIYALRVVDGWIEVAGAEAGVTAAG